MKVPAITNPPIKIYNRAFQTLSFAANSPTATARLTLHVNPDGEDESAEKVTIRFTPGVGTIHGQKMSLSGGKPHLDFSYTVEDDDEPAGRILVEAPADGTVVTEGNSDSEAGEIRLRLTAHRSLAEAAQSGGKTRKFGYSVEGASTATADDDFTFESQSREYTGARGDIGFNFPQNAGGC